MKKLTLGAIRRPLGALGLGGPLPAFTASLAVGYGQTFSSAPSLFTSLRNAYELKRLWTNAAASGAFDLGFSEGGALSIVLICHHYTPMHPRIFPANSG
jgi:hypothetical protein